MAEELQVPDIPSSPSKPLLAYASGGFILVIVPILGLQTIFLEAEMSVPDSETVILITRNGMGDAEPELQQKLISTYFKLLDEHNVLPAAICFYARGVHLVVDGSPVLEVLKSLEKKGVRLILCTTCLNFYNLAAKVEVGVVGGMTDILEAQRLASKVISI